MATTTPRQTPFSYPEPQCKPAPPATLTADQQAKYDQLLETVKSWESLPTSSAKGSETVPLSEDEQLWLTRECLLRYLRATKWNLPHATKRLQDTLVWRREYGTTTFTADYISEENATGKQVLLGFDNEGRPCLYLLPNKQNTPNSPKQVQHLVYMLERTLEITPPGQESLALLIDFRNSSAGSNPSVGTGRAVLNILQNHYPERLGRALVTHLPWYVTIFLKAVGPFIDPVTKSKIKYNEPLTDHVPPGQLMQNAGGEVEFSYDHEAYWPALAALAEERRTARKARWIEGGKVIGESEVYLWGGEAKSLGNKASQETANGVADGIAKLDVKDADADETKKVEEPVTKTEAPVATPQETTPSVVEQQPETAAKAS